MAAAEIPFAELLDRARAGDRGAWAELFRRLGDDAKEGAALHAMARAALPGSDRARDIVDSLDLMQSALKDGWLDASQFQGGTEQEFFGWMRAIIRRKLSRAVRRRRPRIGLEPEAQQRIEDEKAAADSPLASLMREEMQDRVRRAVARLPDDQRDVIRLRLSGLKSPEIAARLGLSPEAVRARESRASRRLREILAEDRGGPDGSCDA